MKQFFEALRDGFTHITDITDPVTLAELRGAGVLVDDEGYWSKSFGDNNEFELCVEPIGTEGNYAVALYKNRVLITEKLLVKVDPLTEKPQEVQ